MVRSRQRASLRTITLTLPSDSNKLSRLSKTASLAPMEHQLPPMDHPLLLITATSVHTASLLPPLMDPPTTSLQPPIPLHTTSLPQFMVPLITSLQLPTTHLHITHMEPLRFRPRLLNSQLVDLVHTHPAVSIQAAMSMETMLTLTSPKHNLPSSQDNTEVHPQYMALNHTPTSSPPPHPMEQQLPSTNPRQTKVFMARTHSLNPSRPHSSNLSRTHSRLRPSSSQ